MLIKPMKVKINAVNDETRDFLGKDGTTKIKRRVVNLAFCDDDGQFCTLTAFDPAFDVPKVGDMFQLPRVKKMECFNGMIQELMV